MTKCRAQIIWQEMENKVTNPTFRHPSRTIAALFLALGLLLAGSPVAEARDAPKQTGPLNFDQRECGRQKFRTRVNGRLELVAKTETCLLLYNYDPLSEDNEERDYAIAWVQARIEPRGAWCAKKVWSDPVSYTHLRAHETKANLVCRLLLEKKKKKKTKTIKQNHKKKRKTKNKINISLQ